VIRTSTSPSAHRCQTGHSRFEDPVLGRLEHAPTCIGQPMQKARTGGLFRYEEYLRLQDIDCSVESGNGLKSDLQDLLARSMQPFV
jgi:hypothetical protein